MNAKAGQGSWAEANRRVLTAALSIVRRAIEHPGDPAAEERAALRDAEAALPAPSSLERLTRSFGLTPFERDTLLLCAAVELDSGFAKACAPAGDAQKQVTPRFDMALASLTGAHWSALLPTAPLRRWRLLSVGPGETLTGSPLRIDERILHYLAGMQYLDARLEGLFEPVAAPPDLPPSQLALAERVAGLLRAESLGPFLHLCGEAGGVRGVAAAAFASLGLSLHAARAQDLPAARAEQQEILRLWEREAVLLGGGLLVECDDAGESLRSLLPGLASFQGRFLLGGRDPLPPSPHRPAIRIDVWRPNASEQRDLWRSSLGESAAGLNGYLHRLSGQFSLDTEAIRAAGAETLGRVSAGKDEPAPYVLESALWEACRSQARPRLDDLAQRIDAAAGWDDLVLPEGQRQTLREVVAHVRGRQNVYDAWGFGAKSTRGMGISALFSGGSGTGKTMAAEVLAGELKLDLYRIDLSAVISKYIGETEKNLRRVFDAAEAGGAVLLFDEADALFGKRSDVKDSHDRYANIEVSYLLQRMESYRGLAILTTNMKGSLDHAFLRRLRFIVEFPFPDAAHRAEMWRRVFPRETPTEGLDAEKLARLNVAGGNIRNIALNAAFLAADEPGPVRMGHLLRAAHGEYAKLERTLADSEVKGWVDGDGR